MAEKLNTKNQKMAVALHEESAKKSFSGFSEDQKTLLIQIQKFSEQINH